MRNKLIWGLAALIILIVIGIAVVLLLRDTDTGPSTNYKIDTEPTKQGVDETVVENDDSTEPRDIKSESVSSDVTAEKPTSPSDVATSKKKIEYATEPGYATSDKGSRYMKYIPRDPERFAHLPEPPLPPSAVPEDCPEHLILKPEWIDGVYRGIEPPPVNDQFDQYSQELGERMRDIVLEIVREYNPKRSYAEIWDQFVEYEKMYRAYAEWELGFSPGVTMTAGRVDWSYEQVWAFPEIIELMMSEDPPYGEENRFDAAHEVAMGYMDQGWNKIILKTGREFFIKGNSRYEFVYSGVTEEGNEWKNTTGFSRIPSTEDAPTVRIDVYNTSDEEFEALMGWDYRINPFTMQPLIHDSSYVTIYPSFAE